MKTTLIVSASQLQALFDAIRNWLDTTETIPVGSPRRVTPLQVLSFRPLKHLARRLQQLLASPSYSGPSARSPDDLQVSVALHELVALYYTIPFGNAEATELLVAMQRIQQLLLSYDQYVTLT